MLENLETLALSLPGLESLPKGLPLQRLRRLRIGNAYLNRENLQTLISSTGNLEEFVYREIEKAHQSTRTALVTCQEIFEMLVPMKDTLKKVVMKVHRSERPPTASTQLVNLEELRMTPGVLCDIPRLSLDDRILDKNELLHTFQPNIRTLCLDTGF
ncbi:hypothetical protein FBEOM_10558 [Fusarium beomiforme]|uniref:Uncharacterized protein n=1 Tax=Fusarium beomiforme TaxID=44412 RepID=A0A9P5AB51_9HYPO|nr:hypothetical protein FBEOM_10558 [Fusarium beomiforme]